MSFISTSRGNSVRPLVFTQQRAPHRRRLILVASAVASVAALIGLVWCCGPSPPGRAIAAEGGRVGESLRAFGKKLRRPAAAAAKPHGTPHWKPHMAPHEKPHGKAALRVDAPLRAARGMYSAPAVEAFAALAKLSYCGPLPGVFSSVALTCSLLEIPGARPGEPRVGRGPPRPSRGARAGVFRRPALATGGRGAHLRSAGA